MNAVYSKLKEVVLSVLPVVGIVLLLHFTVIRLETAMLLRFLIGSALIIVGLTIFLVGIDTGVTPIGSTMGSATAKTNKVWAVIVSGLVLGFIVSIAEPDLHILAEQVDSVTAGAISKLSIVIVVSVGIAVMVATGLLRIVFSFPLYLLFCGLYGLIFILSLFSTPEFLAISFDASGATTGALTVPFVLALALGTSKPKKDSKSSEKDSFGLVGIASAGAIIAVLVMSILSKPEQLAGELEMHAASASIWLPFVQEIPTVAWEILIALIPMVSVFLLARNRLYKLPKNALQRILFGVLLTYVGLILFLVGVNAGFMDIGTVVGYRAASMSKPLVVGIGFVLGLVTILAEPAVNVLTHQIEDVTSGYVPRKLVLLSLSIGVGISVALSMARILIPGLRLWHILLPGYMIAIGLMFIVPKLFIGIAFDSGGVASGPMTATFILAFAHGAAEAAEGASVLVDGFGVIALVAMTPLIALQILGLLFKLKSQRRTEKQ